MQPFNSADTLNTEGIADGIQETFATGRAVGMFGELLERSGVNLDDFNAGLAKPKKWNRNRLCASTDVGSWGLQVWLKDSKK